MHTRPMAATMLGLAVLLAACGSGAASPASTASAAPATAAPASGAPASAPASGAATVNLADTSLGTVLVDGTAMTLYAFTPDNAADPTCYDTCEASWPVLTGASVTAGAGLTAADFGTVTRKDGSAQVTFKKWPLYHFAGDAAAGDVKGQGVGGKWYVLKADGSLVK
jgi:predicted lipoprotein with Yx(FWY)xxD motif